MGISIQILRKSPVLLVDGRTAQTGSLRADAMLLFLCLSGETVHTRESLACLLWEDADAAHSMGSLRQLVHRIRSKLPGLNDIVDFGRAKVTVEQSNVTSDLTQFRNALAENGGGDLPPDLDFALDDLFQPYVGISDSFDSWIAVARKKIESSLRESLSRAFLLGDGNRQTQLYAARNLCLLDPTDEQAVRFLMQHHAESGHQAAALEVYNALYHLLDEDYDIEPAEETQSLVVKVKLGQIIAPPTNPLERPPSKQFDPLPSIYVPDFSVASDDPSLESLTKIFRHELFVNLTTFREWRLFDFEPVVEDGYRLEGLAGRDGDDVHFIATLKLCPDGRIIWSERFRIGFDSWGTVQRDIAKRLSLAVNTRISLDRLKQFSRGSLASQTLFDQWVLAQAHLAEWDPTKNKTAQDLLDKVIARAPDFSPARSSRSNAESVRHLNVPGVFRSPDRLTLGLTHAKHALKIDPLDTRAHLAMGWSLAMSDQYDASILHFETCRDLNPCSTLGSLACALGLAFAGQTDRACEITNEALALVRDIPAYLWGYVQNIRFLDGDLDQAIAAGTRAGSAIANLPAWQAAALWEAGREEEARAVAHDFARLARTRWQAQDTFDHTALVQWFVACFPLKIPEQKRRLQRGLSSALETAFS